MTFADLPAGAGVFVDANTFVYHFISGSGAATPRRVRAPASNLSPWTDRAMMSIVCYRWHPSRTMNDPQFVIEQVTNPAEIARQRARHERARQNGDWLQAHWADLLHQVRGKFVAVAGQEAFIGDTAEDAWVQAEKAHPEDDGALCQYVFPHTGPRFYGHRRRMADV